MIRWFYPGRLSRYPHIKKPEAELLNSFWDIASNNISRCSYDTRVGQGRPFVEHLDNGLKFDWHRLTQLRIDFIFQKENQLFICELKPHAYCQAVGQILVYNHLFIFDYKTGFQTIPTIICYSIHPDVVKFCDINNINIIEVPYNKIL